jgi:hypothetical protein
MTVPRSRVLPPGSPPARLVSHTADADPLATTLRAAVARASSPVVRRWLRALLRRGERAEGITLATAGGKKQLTEQGKK